MKKKLLLTGMLILAGSSFAHAHTPLASCFDNGDSTVTCEGGFSDGSSASGVPVYVKDVSGKVLLENKMNEDSEFTFDKPQGEYVFIFDAGEGHSLTVPSAEIVE